MKERRKYKRFSLTIPARMEMMRPGRKQIFDFETRNISAGGAFIDTSEYFTEGIRFKLDLTVSSQRIKSLTGAKGLIECEGNVVRSTPKGIAVHFDKNCQILSLRGL
jgi:PilZ domain